MYNLLRKMAYGLLPAVGAAVIIGCGTEGMPIPPAPVNPSTVSGHVHSENFIPSTYDRTVHNQYTFSLTEYPNTAFRVIGDEAVSSLDALIAVGDCVRVVIPSAQESSTAITVRAEDVAKVPSC